MSSCPIKQSIATLARAIRQYLDRPETRENPLAAKSGKGRASLPIVMVLVSDLAFRHWRVLDNAENHPLVIFFDSLGLRRWAGGRGHGKLGTKLGDSVVAYRVPR